MNVLILFKPILAIMNRARYLHKFGLILMVFMLPYCWLSIEKIYTLYCALEDARRELLGLQAIDVCLQSLDAALNQAALGVVCMARDRPDCQERLQAAQSIFQETQAKTEARLRGNRFAALLASTPVPTITTQSITVQGIEGQFTEHARGVRARLETIRQIAVLSRLAQDNDVQVNADVNLLLSRIIPFYLVMAQTSQSNEVFASGLPVNS